MDLVDTSFHLPTKSIMYMVGSPGVNIVNIATKGNVKTQPGIRGEAGHLTSAKILLDSFPGTGFFYAIKGV